MTWHSLQDLDWNSVSWWHFLGIVPELAPSYNLFKANPQARYSVKVPYKVYWELPDYAETLSWSYINDFHTWQNFQATECTIKKVKRNEVHSRCIPQKKSTQKTTLVVTEQTQALWVGFEPNETLINTVAKLCNFLHSFICNFESIYLIHVHQPLLKHHD